MTPPPPERPGDRARRLLEQAREQERRDRQALVDRVDALERRVDAGGGGGTSEAVVQELRSLADRLDALEGAARHKPAAAPFHWEHIDDPDERARLWSELETWLDEVLIARYPAYARGVRECWAKHPAAVDLLKDAWLAWLGSYDPGARLLDPWAWQRDVLANLPRLLETALEGCEH